MFRKLILDMLPEMECMTAEAAESIFTGYCVSKRYLYCKKFITRKEYIKNCLVRTTVGMIPGGAREKFYHLFLRNVK